MARSSPRQVRLRRPLERTVAHGHPWIYRDALVPHALEPGCECRVLDRRDRFLARGLVESGPIGVRVFSRRDHPLDEGWWTERVERAFELRTRVIPPDTNAYRLLHGEGDGLPGFVVDRYADAAVLKLDGEAATRFVERLIRILEPRLRKLGVRGLLQKSKAGANLCWGELASPPLSVTECGMRLLVDLERGQKTGLFLDHRPNRARVRQLAKGLRVLNLYAYTGGFSVAAGLGGAAEVTSVDLAGPAIDLARQTWAANALDPKCHVAVRSDVEAFLHSDTGTFDLVVADPPSFAPRESAVAAALKAYKALHRAALAAVRPGGFYLAASCSSHVGRSAFEQTLRESGHACRLDLQVLERSGAGADHPVPLGFPEGDYLSAILCRVHSK